MRTFIAVEPPESLRSEIGRLQSGILKRHLPDFRWVEPHNIHLTLRFLGEIDPGALAQLKETVGRAAAGFAPFGLEVERIGHFGPERSPRIIWLGLKESALLAGLAAAVEKGLVEGGFGRADKPFKAHLTLARMKNPTRRAPDWAGLREELPAGWPDWPVEQVEIIKSTLTPSGPIYEILASCPLQGSPGTGPE